MPSAISSTTSGYRRLFALPGARAFTTGNVLARLPMGMFSVSAVVMIAGSRGSYALAGAVTATGLAATALAGPWLARLVDRHGQARVAVPATLVSVLGSLTLLLCVRYGAPDWTLFAAYALTAATPNIGGLSRARWAHLLGEDAGALHTANSFEQAADELCFMLGPVLASFLTGTFFPEAGTLTGAVLLLAGMLLFTAQRATEPPPRARTQAPSPLRSPGIPPLLACFTATGAVFGSMEVVTIAYADAQGHRTAAGVILALQAAGSCAAGLAFGALKPKHTATHADAPPAPGSAALHADPALTPKRTATHADSTLTSKRTATHATPTHTPDRRTTHPGTALTPDRTATRRDPAPTPDRTTTHTDPTLTPDRTATHADAAFTPRSTAPHAAPALTPQRTATRTDTALTPQRTATHAGPAQTPQRTATHPDPALTPKHTATHPDPAQAPECAVHPAHGGPVPEGSGGEPLAAGPGLSRWLAAMAVLMTLPWVAAATAGALPVLAGALLVAGMATAPTMVTAMGLVQRRTPADRLNEGMSLVVTGLLTGIACGSATGGWATEHLSPVAAFAVPAVAAALALLIDSCARAAGSHRRAVARGSVLS